MSILVSVQSVFFGELGDGFLETLGQELAGQMYPFKSMLRAVMKIGGSSIARSVNLIRV